LVNKSVKAKWFALLGSVCICIVITLILPKANHSIYIDYHYYYYLVSMILGMILAQTTNKYILKAQEQNKIMRVLWFLVSMGCCLSYFVIIEKCKGENNPYYYYQLFALLPLNLMAFFIYLAFTGVSVNRVVTNNIILRYLIITISQLSLEIYIVQFVVISGNFNHIFPYNFLVNYLFVLFAAFCLKVLSNIFVDIFNDKDISFVKWLTI